MTEIFSCIFLGILMLLAVGGWAYNTLPKIRETRRKRIKYCNVCKKRIYQWQPQKTVNTASGWYREHQKCHDKNL